MMPRIYFYANCGDMKKLPFGGGEVGNRRTLTLFKEMGYDIVHIEKYSSLKLNNKLLNSIIVIAKACVNLMEFFFILLLGRRRKSIVHIVGFYGQLVYFEFLLVGISKVLGYKTVYEMRGGGAEQYYYELGKSYRIVFDYIINNCDYIFSQGKENYDLLAQINSSRKAFYYPNFVTDKFIPESIKPKTFDTLNLLYFGRLSEKKNISTIIDIAQKVQMKYPQTKLTLIGRFNSKEYKRIIENKIEKSNMAGHIIVLPQCDQDSLKIYLKDAHFFIFPSSEPREGHSNSITEAMAYGVIPISSSQGFSRSVISDDRLIAKEIDADYFSNIINEIISSGQFESISKALFQRVKDNYSKKTVYNSFKENYNKLFG